MTWEDLKDEPTAELIGYVQCKNEPAYQVLANAAFEALTYRFQAKLTDRCRKVGKTYIHDKQESDTIATMAFERFYRYPFKFAVAKCKKLATDDCFVLYLYKIAQRCYFDNYTSKLGENVSPYTGTEEVIVELPALDELSLDEDQLEFAQAQRAIITKAFENLTPKHKIIYCTYLVYEERGLYLPRPLLAKLRETLELDQDSIRVYKLEVKREIKRLRDGNEK